MRFIDLTGQKFGSLTVIERSYTKSSYTYWKCKCDCGIEKIVQGGNLKSGGTKSCGQNDLCRVVRNLTGQKFGRLLVLSFAYTTTKKSFWKCKCDCGREKNILGKSLVNGRSKSCGCLRKSNIKVLASTHGLSQNKAYRHQRHLSHTYGITPEIYLSFFDNQDYRCPGCGKELEPYSHDVNVDHDHNKSGYESVRGVLCSTCNHLLGCYEKVKSWAPTYLNEK